MASSVLMFLEAMSKCRLKRTDFSHSKTVLSYTLVILCVVASVDSVGSGCDQLNCVHGECENRTTQSLSQDQDVVCVCEPGWTGTHCESCGGRIR